MRDYHELKVWQNAHQLTLLVYEITREFHRDERFGLTDQLRRSAASIAANLAEACGRGGNDFGRFCQIAMGSACETEYHLELSRDLGLMTAQNWERANALVISTKRMLIGLLRTKQSADVALR